MTDEIKPNLTLAPPVQQAAGEFDNLEILQFFGYHHLPGPLQAASKPFFEVAAHIAGLCPDNQERLHALRKLLEAKDCAVRSLIQKVGK